MGGVPIIGDVVEAVEDVGKKVGSVISGKKKTTAVTRAAEVAKETLPAAKKDITRTLRRRTSKLRRGSKSLVGGMLAGGGTATTQAKDLNPIRNPRDQSTLG